jgi:hypothetical protein
MGGLVLARPMAEFTIGIVDRPQQFDENRRLFNGPKARERRSERVQIVLSQQTHGNDTILGHG